MVYRADEDLVFFLGSNIHLEAYKLPFPDKDIPSREHKCYKLHFSSLCDTDIDQAKKGKILFFAANFKLHLL